VQVALLLPRRKTSAVRRTGTIRVFRLPGPLISKSECQSVFLPDNYDRPDLSQMFRGLGLRNTSRSRGTEFAPRQFRAHRAVSLKRPGEITTFDTHRASVQHRARPQNGSVRPTLQIDKPTSTA